VADDRLTIREAAVRLGVSEGAIRKRIDRGTLRHDRDPDGRIHVYVDAGDTAGTTSGTTRESNALISEMRGRIESLEHQLGQTNELLERQMEEANERDRENRRLLAAALERIPSQLEAPAEPPSAAPGDAETVDEQQGRGQPRSAAPGAQEDTQPRSWWRSMFGR
jgi:excisionase family DNA binding protein